MIMPPRAKQPAAHTQLILAGAGAFESITGP
jgi:hypothetical protein